MAKKPLILAMQGLKSGNMENKGIKSLVQVSLMVASVVIISQISIPTALGVPITLQILAIGLVGYLFSTKKSLLVLFIYVAIGAIGIPVFANFNGGLFHLINYTGGFIWGFFPLVVLCSLKTGKLKIPMGILGVLICHFIGALQYSLVGKVPFYVAMMTSSLPFILKDMLLLIASYFLAKMILKRIKTN